MAAAAADRLTPASIHWAFGDGGTASGGAVSHAFGSAGAFTVTVTATDGVGNATADTRPILVAAARRRSGSRRGCGSPGASAAASSSSSGSASSACPRARRSQLPLREAQGQQKCPFSSRELKRIRNKTITLFKEVKASKVRGKKKRTFRAGQRLQLRITAKGYIGKVVRYKLKKSKIPSGRNLCLPEGAKKARKRCTGLSTPLPRECPGAPLSILG